MEKKILQEKRELMQRLEDWICLREKETGKEGVESGRGQGDNSSMAMRSLGQCDQVSGFWVLVQALSLTQTIQVHQALGIQWRT